MCKIGSFWSTLMTYHLGVVIALSSRRRVSLSDLFADACRRMDITPEQALGCERTKDRLRLMIAEDRAVDFELVDDPENDSVMLGSVLES
jgi:hypothetical protein